MPHQRLYRLGVKPCSMNSEAATCRSACMPYFGLLPSMMPAAFCSDTRPLVEPVEAEPTETQRRGDVARHRHADAESVTDVTNAEPAMTAGVARTRRYRASHNAESGPRARRPSRGSG